MSRWNKTVSLVGSAGAYRRHRVSARAEDKKTFEGIGGNEEDADTHLTEVGDLNPASLPQGEGRCQCYMWVGNGAGSLLR